MRSQPWEITTERLWTLLELERSIFAVVLDPDFRVAYVSPSTENVLGYAAGELIGEPALSLIYPEDALAVEVVLTSLLSEPGETSTQLNAKVRHRNGSWRTLAISVRNREAQGEIYLLLAATDVTERDQLEMQLRGAQRMEAVGRLAGGIAHDFNNLLTAIMGNTELLLLDMAADDPRRDGLEEIRSAGDRAKSLTRQLLAFSGQRSQHRRTVRPGDLVTRVQRMLERMIGEDIALRVELESTSATVHVDPPQIEEVLMNLAINARDAMPSGGSLTFTVAQTSILQTDTGVPYFVQPGVYVAIRVRDTGTGMPPHVQTRIFEPFFTTKSADKGTGLGLSTAYGIVKQSGGYIWAESVVGSGTVLHLLLPRSEAVPDEEAAAETILPLPVSSGHVFFVEDDAQVRRFGVKALELGGFQVSAFGIPEEALAAFTAVSRGVDVLVTDVVMPGMSGPELAAACTAVHDLPVLYLSGYSREVVGEHGIGNGVHLLPKPLTATELVAAVQAVIRGAQ
jgi:PAS domain S-box-containing protein